MNIQKYYKTLFNYDNGFLYAKIKCGQRRNIGTLVGDIYTNHGKKYHRANVDGKPKQLHNIIWIMHNGKIPNNMKVTHINNNTLDNRIENLMLVESHLVFTRNKLRQDNSSGMAGVSYYKRDNNWRVTINHKGKMIHIGYFETIEEAKIARESAMKQYNYLGVIDV